MFGAFKRLFSKQDSAPPSVPEAPADDSTFSPDPATVASEIEISSTEAPSDAQPGSELIEPASYQADQADAPPPAAAPEETIQIPLKPILDRLPPALLGLAKPSGSGTYALPLSTTLAQLRSGIVKIPFGEVRRGSSPGAFSSEAIHDQVLVEIPLREILVRLDPSLLSRRADQKEIELPKEVTGVFDSSGSVRISPRSQNVTASAPEPKPAPKAPVSIPSTLPAAAVPIPAPAPVAPPVPPAPPRAAEPPSRSPDGVPKPKDFPYPNISPKVAAALRLDQTVPKPPPSTTAGPPPAAGSSQAPVSVPLAQVSEGWPDAIRNQIRQFKLDGASACIPFHRLDAGVKAGRVTFTWGELAQWVTPPPPQASWSQTDTQLQLPLQVIIPIFLAQRPSNASQRNVELTEAIPDIFFGRNSSQTPAKPKPAIPAPTAPAIPPPAPVESPLKPALPKNPIPAVSPLPKLQPTPATPPPATPSVPPTTTARLVMASESAKPGDSFGALLGTPGKTNWSPQEIVQATRTLPGVVGTLIALTDGLLVAADFPPHLKAETFAAFLPQVFGRMNQYAKELQLGQLTSMTLEVGNAPCSLFKAGTVYFVVLGKAGEELPTAKLRAIAAESAHQNF